MPGKNSLVVVVVALCSVSLLAQEETTTVRSGGFPRTHDNIHLEMVFNYGLTKSQLSMETGVVDQVWGSDWANLPKGMYNVAYIPISVDKFTKSVKWYKTNHP